MKTVRFIAFIILISQCMPVFASGSDSPDLSDSELSGIVSAVLNHPDVSIYLHPEVPGRVPLVVAIGKPYSYRNIDVSMFGEEIVVTTDPADLKKAVKLRISCDTGKCLVKIGYDPEGIFGEIELTPTDDEWSVTKAVIYE